MIYFITVFFLTIFAFYIKSLNDYINYQKNIISSKERIIESLNSRIDNLKKENKILIDDYKNMIRSFNRSSFIFTEEENQSMNKNIDELLNKL